MPCLLFILLVKITGTNLQPTFFIILNVWAEFTIDLINCLKCSGRVYNKNGNGGPSLHLPNLHHLKWPSAAATVCIVCI